MSYDPRRNTGRSVRHPYTARAPGPAFPELDICVDCLMFHANGDTPERWRSSSSDDGETDDGKPETAEENTARYLRAVGDDHVAIGKGEGSFSYHACDSCWSTLGGDRYQAFLIPNGWGRPRFADRNHR